MAKTKDPLKVKAGKARWKGVPTAVRKKIASKNGTRGAAVFWKRYKTLKKKVYGRP